MNGTFRSATGVMAVCDEEGCVEVAGVVVGPRHLCPAHGWEDEQCWKALAHLQLRPMSAAEVAARKEAQ